MSVASARSSASRSGSTRRRARPAARIRACWISVGSDERPRRRDHGSHEGRVEVVEGGHDDLGGDRPECRPSARKVVMIGGQTEGVELLTRFRREVDEAVHEVGHRTEPAGEFEEIAHARNLGARVAPPRVSAARSWGDHQRLTSVQGPMVQLRRSTARRAWHRRSAPAAHARRSAPLGGPGCRSARRPAGSVGARSW